MAHCAALNTNSLEINKVKDNLAGLEFDHLWEGSFYYLYGDTGHWAQLYAMLGKVLVWTEVCAAHLG